MSPAAMANLSAIISYDEDYPLLMPKWGYAAAAFALFLIGFFGFFLNLMVILLMMKDRQLWTPLNMILFNLVGSDFCVSIMGNPLTLISALYHQWVFGQTMCMLYGFFMALLGISSITSLTVLSFERYLMVTRPLCTQHRSKTTTALMIAGIWIYSLMLTTPPLFGWGNYVSEAANISCSVNWHEQSTNTLTYILFLFAFGQVIPFSVISFSYINILRTIRRNSKQMGQVGRAENKVTMMVLVMIIAFAVAWTPYSVFALLEQFAASGIISPGLGVIPALVAKSSICYDPLIYIGMNTQFRQSIRKLFSGKSKGSTSHTENKGADNKGPVSPTHKMEKELDRRQSSESNTSNATKKHVIILDKKVPCADLVNVQIEESNNPFKQNTTPAKRSKATIENFENPVYNMDGNGDALEKIGDGTNNDDSPVVTILDEERLIFRKNLGASTNKGFELALVETMDQEPVYEGRRRLSSTGLVHSYSSNLLGARQKRLEQSRSFGGNIDSIIEPESERHYIKRSSFIGNLAQLGSSDDQDFG